MHYNEGTGQCGIGIVKVILNVTFSFVLEENYLLYNSNNYFCIFHGIQTLMRHASFQVGVAVYGRYSSTVPPVSYLAHIWGSLAGITIGLVVLQTFQQKPWER